MCLPKVQSTQSNNCNTDDTFFVSVETFAEKPQKQIDMKDYNTTEKLAELKEKDPFMFYSIPQVQDAVLHGRRTDPSSMQVELHPEGPSGTGTESGTGGRVVKRRSRLALESHSCVLFEELLGAESTDTNNLEPRNDDDYLDFFMSFETEQSVKRMRRA